MSLSTGGGDPSRTQQVGGERRCRWGVGRGSQHSLLVGDGEQRMDFGKGNNGCLLRKDMDIQTDRHACILIPTWGFCDTTYQKEGAVSMGTQSF